MKQGFEFNFTTRPDEGEAPEGARGGFYTTHFFSYDPKTDIATDLGPGYRQEGMVSFCADTERGYLYAVSDPSEHFLVYDLKTGHTWNAGVIAGNALPDIWPSTMIQAVYITRRGYPRRKTIYDCMGPKEFRLRDYEIAVDDTLKYRHFLYHRLRPAGSNKLYGANWYPDAFEMDLKVRSDGKLHVSSHLPGHGRRGRILGLYELHYSWT